MLSTVWSVLFIIGALGLLAQVLLGGHTVHHSGRGAGPTPLHSHVSPVPVHGHPSQRAATDRSLPNGRADSAHRMSLLLSLFSPLTLFSICLGAGAIGLLLKHTHVTIPIDVLCASVGGLVFYGAIIRPLMSIMLNFASTPSQALEGALAEPAEVVSRFDSTGQGLVKLIVDGQVVRVLATLEESDRSEASQIAPGDRLVVTYIDGRSNACRVTRI